MALVTKRVRRRIRRQSTVNADRFVERRVSAIVKAKEASSNYRKWREEAIVSIKRWAAIRFSGRSHLVEHINAEFRRRVNVEACIQSNISGSDRVKVLSLLRKASQIKNLPTGPESLERQVTPIQKKAFREWKIIQREIESVIGKAKKRKLDGVLFGFSMAEIGGGYSEEPISFVKKD